MNTLASSAAAWIVAAALAGLLASIKHIWGKLKSTDNGMMALLHSELYKECKECELKKCATIDDLENIERLYNPYHSLGGNGTGTVLYERVKTLPSEPAERG